MASVLKKLQKATFTFTFYETVTDPGKCKYGNTVSSKLICPHFRNIYQYITNPPAYTFSLYVVNLQYWCNAAVTYLKHSALLSGESACVYTSFTQHTQVTCPKYLPGLSLTNGLENVHGVGLFLYHNASKTWELSKL